MDEVEKYQQRLQAIAEKRRLQEEEERAKRQLEDDKLRLQQLKRKSLRDQWLMEGSPLPPHSAVPQSPVWESQPQQNKEHNHKLQSEIIDQTHKNIEEGLTSAQSHTDHHSNGSVNAVTPPSGTSVNRQEKSSDTSHDPSLTNGTAPHPESHNTPLQHGDDIIKGVETLLFLGYTEAEPGQGLRDDDDDDDDVDDDDVVSAVICAERVMITEEGEVTQQMPSEEEEEVEELEEEKEEEKQKGQEEEEDEEEREKESEEKQKGQEEEGDEEEREKESEEGEKEQVEERETDCQEQSAVDDEDHPETWAEELAEERLQNNNTDVDSLSDKVTLHTDEETSADADTHMVRDSNSPLNTDLISDADLAAVSEMETPGGDVQTASGPKSSSASTLNTNGAQKSPGHPSATTHTAAPFQDIPLGGATVEEEPLLATKVEPLTNTTNRNQTDEAKRKTCKCCTVM